MTIDQDVHGVDMAFALENVRRHMHAEHRHDVDAAVACFTDDCHYEVPARALRLRGKAEIAEWYRGLFAGVPDYKDGDEQYWVCDTGHEPFVLYRATMQGTHTGLWHGWPPTGRSFRVPMLVRIPIAPDGLMLAEEVYFDSGMLSQQLGLMPAPGSVLERAGQRLVGARAAMAARLGRRDATDIERREATR